MENYYCKPSEYKGFIVTPCKNILHEIESNNKTLISEWEGLILCSNRLKSILLGGFICHHSHISYGVYKCYERQIIYIEDITKNIFRRKRGAGLIAWNEFVDILLIFKNHK